MRGAMKVIVGDRQTGKTTALVEHVKSNGAVLLCANRARAEYVRATFDLPDGQVQVLNGRYRRGQHDHVAIDDLDELIRHYIAPGGTTVDIAAIQGQLWTPNDEPGCTCRREPGTNPDCALHLPMEHLGP
jgi:hypothetical protein